MIAWSVLSMVTVLVLGLYISSLIERKMGADIQARVGPNRAGAFGLLQPFADVLRFFVKRSGAAANERAQPFWWVQGIPLFLMLFFVPFGTGRPLVQVELGSVASVFLILSFTWSGLFLAWQVEQIQGRFISVRQANLAVAISIPVLISISLAGMAKGGLGWERIIDSQGFWPNQWLVFSSPAGFAAAAVFLMSGMILFSVSPFSTGGHLEIYLIANRRGRVGVRELWIRASNQIALLCWFVLLIQVFFGGAHVPAVFERLDFEPGGVLLLFGTLSLLAKLLVLSALLTAVSKSLPRVRADQTHQFVWKFLLPLAFLSLILSRVLQGISIGMGL